MGANGSGQRKLRDDDIVYWTGHDGIPTKGKDGEPRKFRLIDVRRKYGTIRDADIGDEYSYRDLDVPLAELVLVVKDTL